MRNSDLLQELETYAVLVPWCGKVCTLGQPYIFCNMGACSLMAEYDASKTYGSETCGFYSKPVFADIQCKSH